MLLLEAYPPETLEGFAEEVVSRVTASLDYFGAEFRVAIAAMGVLLLDLVCSPRASRQLAWLAIAACVWPLPSVFGLGHSPPEDGLFFGMLAIDSYANFFKVFFLLGAIPVILLSYMAKELEGVRMGEYYFILLSTVFAGMLMASSTHFLTAILSLELLSICSYILVGFHKRQRASSEASLKYIIYGSVAAAIMIYGMSLLYGLAGTGNIPQVGERVASILAAGADGASGQLQFTVVVALLLTFLGLAYKMATIPMHFWCPDVYEGAPTPITAFLSVASKAAGFALALRFFGSMPELVGEVSWTVVMVVVGIATMTLGNLAALWQENLKRLFAYSSIAHAGYMMMGLLLVERVEGAGGMGSGHSGAQLVAFYLLAYLAMNLGSFAVVILIENRTGSVNLKEYEGLGWRAPFLGLSLSVFLFSLIGIPPTAGFTGKFQLLLGVIDRALMIEDPLRLLYIIMAVAVVINTAISVYYYVKIIRNMYLVRIDEGVERLRSPLLGTLVVLAMLIMTFYLFLDADSILEHTLQLELNGAGRH